MSGRETAEESASCSGGEPTPAVSVAGTPPIVSVDCAHARKDRHAPLCRASAMSTAQSVSPTPHAPLPGFSGSTTSPESRTAAASRSRSCPVCAAKSAFERPVVLRGAHAKPQWSLGCALVALKWRSAFTCADRYAAICSTGTIVQPHAVSRGHAPFASGLYV